jgi:ATP adenylyltransferase
VYAILSDADLLAGTDLRAPARLGPPIHADQARIHRGVGLATARDEVCSLEQLVQRDVLTTKRETNFQIDSPVRRSNLGRTNDDMTNEPTTSRPAPRTTLQMRDIDSIIARARRNGDLYHIETEQTLIPTPAGDFLVRWVSSLQHKRETRKPSSATGADFNPFLSPEPALVIAPLAPEHICLLNKYPVIDRHLLIVTQQFEDQTAPLHAGDFQALATIIQSLDGLGFYNGGAQAGASQRHKHLQWIPESRQSSNFIALTHALEAHCAHAPGPCRHPALPFRHVFMRLAATGNDPTYALADALHTAYLGACGALAIDTGQATLPPYNLLANRHWLLLVPRSQECFEDISVNALGFAASLFVRERSQLARIRTAGPLAVLSAVAYPD